MEQSREEKKGEKARDVSYSSVSSKSVRWMKDNDGELLGPSANDDGFDQLIISFDGLFLVLHTQIQPNAESSSRRTSEPFFTNQAIKCSHW